MSVFRQSNHQKNISFKWIKERKNSSIFFVFTFFLGLTLVLYPFTPELTFFLAKLPPRKALGQKSNPKISHLAMLTEAGHVSGTQAQVKSSRWLTIRKIGVDASVYELRDKNNLTNHIAHLSASSTPDSGGNTVLIAHRWLYTSGPNTFYHLPKLKLGDEVELSWDGKTYVYKVTLNKKVDDTDTSVEATTTSPTLTLYTCDFFSENTRIVIQAELVSKV